MTTSIIFQPQLRRKQKQVLSLLSLSSLRHFDFTSLCLKYGFILRARRGNGPVQSQIRAHVQFVTDKQCRNCDLTLPVPFLVSVPKSTFTVSNYRHVFMYPAATKSLVLCNSKEWWRWFLVLMDLPHDHCCLLLFFRAGCKVLYLRATDVNQICQIFSYFKNMKSGRVPGSPEISDFNLF